MIRLTDGQVKMAQSSLLKVLLFLVTSTLIIYLTFTNTRRDKGLRKLGSLQSFATITEKQDTLIDLRKPGSLQSSAAITEKQDTLKGFNGTMLKKYIPTPGGLSNISQFHLLALFFNVKSEEQYASFSTDQHDRRNREYMDVLQSNLNHECVSKIHLFYLLNEDMKVILGANLTNRHKLQPVKWHRLLHMADFFLYASRNLVNKSVIALNGDIALGEGFEQINPNALLNENHFYSLSRYENNVSCSRGYKKCSKRYNGSHDTHIFALSKPLNEPLLLEKLDYPINMYQGEQGMLFTMRKYFGFNVLNPCKTLKTYHHHCSVVHGPRRVDNYTILSLGWTQEQIKQGKAKPCTLQEV